MVSYTPRMMFLNYNNDNNNMEINPCLNDIQLWIANQLKVVWISHPHADHHLGLVINLFFIFIFLIFFNKY